MVTVAAVAVRPSRSSASTSNNNRRRINRQKDGCAVRAILPRPEGRGLSRIWSINKALISQVSRLLPGLEISFDLFERHPFRFGHESRDERAGQY
ncbi:MAG: hypothetical protein KJ822_19845, partial [Proteobacteria bacterium]|nr:hypothetical protein [Pseudomonadota bacterium]